MVKYSVMNKMDENYEKAKKDAKKKNAEGKWEPCTVANLAYAMERPLYGVQIDPGAGLPYKHQIIRMGTSHFCTIVGKECDRIGMTDETGIFRDCSECLIPLKVRK